MNDHSIQKVNEIESGANAETVPPIEWFEQTVTLSSLRPFEQNPRDITDNQMQKLRQSLIEDGYHSRIKVTHDYRVIGGHQRLRVMQELGYDYVKVLVPDRVLSDDQFYRIMLRDNHSNGTWDMDALANMFDLEFLRMDIGLHDIMGIVPEDKEPPASKTHVKCPNCEHVFEKKGNAA